MKQTYRSWAKKRRPKLRDNIWRLLAPSVLSMIVCMICLVGLTMAWFSSSVETETKPISTTWFEGATPRVNLGPTEINPTNDWYELKKGNDSAGNLYGVALTGNSNAPENIKPGTGYAIIYMKTSLEDEGDGDLVGVTDPIEFNEVNYTYSTQLSFSVKPLADCYLRIEYRWGTPSEPTIHANTTKELTDNSKSRSTIISYPDPYTAAMLNAQELLNEQTTGEDEANAEKDKAKTYTVKKGDTLESIAKANGITVKQLAEYNKLEVTDKIKVGQELKIPPKDSEKPTKPDKETTEKQTEESPTQSDKKAPSEETTAKATTNQTTTVDSEKPDTTTKAKEDKPEPTTEKSPVTTTEAPSEAEEETEEPAADPSVEDSTEVSETTTQPESEAEQVGQALKDQSPADE